jgi:hypothetical protein
LTRDFAEVFRKTFFGAGRCDGKYRGYGLCGVDAFHGQAEPHGFEDAARLLSAGLPSSDKVR